MNKRFASLAVSALLLVSLLSVPALAEGTEAAADAAGDDHVIVTLNPEAALQPETPAEAAASATETAQADPAPSADDAEEAATAAEVKADDTKKDEQLTYVALGDSIVSSTVRAPATASIWLPTSMAILPTAMSARWLQLSASTVTTPSTSACRP